MSRLQLRTPSFRSRLRLFFVVIVVVPMITMAVVLFQLIVASERSQTDARLAQSQTVSQEIVRELEAEAGEVAGQIGSDQLLADAIAQDRRPGHPATARHAGRAGRTRYVQLQLEDVGRFESGGLPAVAPVERRLVDEEQQRPGASSWRCSRPSSTRTGSPSSRAPTS